MSCDQHYEVCKWLHNFMAHHLYNSSVIMAGSNKHTRGTRFASESVLVIKEQILGINYNLEKFYSCSH